MDEAYIDLLTLQDSIQEGLEDLFPDKLWVKAEVSSIQVKSNGHCYMDLCQSGTGGVVAKAKAVIWRSRYTLLSRMFREAAGGDIQAGMSILVRVQVSYSALYGLTLTIDDIDPDVTLGEQERIRRETIAKLQEEGLMEKQGELKLPPLPYSLAVISAPDAAGFGDFRRHLLENEYGFAFSVDLFPATMQGNQAPESISDALEEVQTASKQYDAVLILRGGGSNFDLQCFDDYGLCFNIANCPLPVFTAIGHDKDYHVADMVAYSFVKTPTALADEFIGCYMAEDERIESYMSRLRLAFNSKLQAMASKVDMLVERINAADPRCVLSRGYTLVTDSRGVVLKGAGNLKAGDRVRIMFADGSVNAVITD
ncbi:MAG: exodeoxyribonuclease VII large subunit [Bacteroidales bacterium]|nr:exodeoxyribonuclease VII large subunit [Bacteroidales bacterium]